MRTEVYRSRETQFIHTYRWGLAEVPLSRRVGRSTLLVATVRQATQLWTKHLHESIIFLFYARDTLDANP
jgi:hypothetical protein